MVVRRRVAWRDHGGPQVAGSRLGVIRQAGGVGEHVGALWGRQTFIRMTCSRVWFQNNCWLNHCICDFAWLFKVALYLQVVGSVRRQAGGSVVIWVVGGGGWRRLWGDWSCDGLRFRCALWDSWGSLTGRILVSFCQFNHQRLTKQKPLHQLIHYFNTLGRIYTQLPDGVFSSLLVNICTHHVFEASQHRSSNDAQKEGHDVEDCSGPQQVIEVHHVLAALHICVFMVASNHLYTASPVGGTERETAYSQATKSQ